MRTAVLLQHDLPALNAAIPAVRLLRESADMSLTEAKWRVEQIMESG